MTKASKQARDDRLTERLAVGAGLGVSLGILIGGGAGIALGAGLGVAAGAAWHTLTSR